MSLEYADEPDVGVRARSECDGEMHPADDDGRDGAGLYTVECSECRSIGGVNVETLTVYGAADRLEIVESGRRVDYWCSVSLLQKYNLPVQGLIM